MEEAMYAVTRFKHGNGLQSAVDSLFGQIFEPAAAPGWAPAMDVAETPDAYVIRVDVPGVDPKAMEISVANGVLEIKGERAGEAAAEGEGWHRRERRRGAFARTVTLPGEVDASRVVAESRNGVLTVTPPKREELRPRRIEIREA